MIMKLLQANNDPTKYALIDDDIAEIINDMNLKFSIQPNGYFYSTKLIQLQGMEKKKQLLLHHFVWILKTSEEPTSSIDHININPANNCFSNLRLATIQQQQQHRGRMKNNKSGYIGVHHNVDKRGNGYDYWFTSIRKPDGRSEVKSFQYTPEGLLEAGKWYDSKAIEYFGEFHGQLNFPDDN